MSIAHARRLVRALALVSFVAPAHVVAQTADYPGPVDCEGAPADAAIHIPHDFLARWVLVHCSQNGHRLTGVAPTLWLTDSGPFSVFADPARKDAGNTQHDAYFTRMHAYTVEGRQRQEALRVFTDGPQMFDAVHQLEALSSTGDRYTLVMYSKDERVRLIWACWDRCARGSQIIEVRTVQELLEEQ